MACQAQVFTELAKGVDKVIQELLVVDFRGVVHCTFFVVPLCWTLSFSERDAYQSVIVIIRELIAKDQTLVVFIIKLTRALPEARQRVAVLISIRFFFVYHRLAAVALGPSG